MLILCTGSDTFRAQHKAHELEKAFKDKYDNAGNSVERLSDGKTAINEVLERVQTISLFNPRRFLRTSNLLSECSKIQLPFLAKAMARDPERVIVVSVEAEEPAGLTMKAFEDKHKLIRYDFPRLEGKDFADFVLHLAKTLELTDTQTAPIGKLAQHCDGDSWLAWNELLKLRAGGVESLTMSYAQESIYSFCDEFLQDKNSWHRLLSEDERSGQAISIILSQIRSTIRVTDKATQGLKSFIVHKLKHLKGKDRHGLESSLARALVAHITQRYGYGTETETLTSLK